MSSLDLARKQGWYVKDGELTKRRKSRGPAARTKVRLWRVRGTEGPGKDTKVLTEHFVWAPNRLLARLVLNDLYPMAAMNHLKFQTVRDEGVRAQYGNITAIQTI